MLGSVPELEASVWWEQRRKLYNIALVVAGLGAFACYAAVLDHFSCSGPDCGRSSEGPEIDALVGPEPTQLTAGLEVSSCGNRQGPSFVNGSEPHADRQPRLVRADQRQHLHSELLLQLLVVAIRSSRICDASTG